MLSTELSTILQFLPAVCAILSVIAAGFCLKTLRTREKTRFSLNRVVEIETALTELHDSYDALLASHKKLRSRIGMRLLREKRGASNEANEGLNSDDKTALRIAAKRNGLLR